MRNKSHRKRGRRRSKSRCYGSPKKRFSLKRGHRFGDVSDVMNSKLGLASAIAIIILLRSGFWSYKYDKSFKEILNSELTNSAQSFLFSMSIDSLFDIIEHLLGWSRGRIDRNLVVAIYLAISGIRQNKT